MNVKRQLHFRTDAPIELKSLFFFPSYHTEKFGMARMEPGVSLYSRKVGGQALAHATVHAKGRDCGALQIAVHYNLTGSDGIALQFVWKRLFVRRKVSDSGDKAFRKPRAVQLFFINSAQLRGRYVLRHPVYMRLLSAAVCSVCAHRMARKPALSFERDYVRRPVST